MSKNGIVYIRVDGIEKLEKGLNQFSKEIDHEMAAAGEAVAKEIIWTEGIGNYPGETAGNKPPTPYYIRGRGTQTASGNLFNSERYGSQFFVEQQGPFTTAIGNRASYGIYLGGEKQLKTMARIGWKKLFDVAVQKRAKIMEIYHERVDHLIKKLGL